ncbi:D-arabinono-1,4-lactone oxidase [Nocardia alni]|uniref:D-arabinono-1,4-lactone oxidase n=1 Tax=Nocardia alni TaxID=2815723 RepID=UPI001C23A83F|nr:D-arabinono-1,4-lactone oxidase [Nocardia alni]
MTNSWVNWAGDQRCAPAVLAAPHSRDELSALLERAEAEDRVVRAFGAGHSFTDTALTSGILVDTTKLNRVLDVDLANARVRVEGGARLHELNDTLYGLGLAFPNLGDIDVQSIAGATATATHGTGGKLQNLSAALHSVELMLADGSVVELDERTDPDGWRAARVNVGALGIVTAVTLQLVPAFVLEGVERPIPFDEVLAGLDDYVDSNDHFEFYMFAHSSTAMTKRNNRVDLHEQPRGKLTEWFADVVLNNYAFDVLTRLCRVQPKFIPPVQRFAASAGSYRRQVERSYRVFASPRLFRFTEMEYAVPREHAAEVIREIKEIGRHYDTPMPTEVRFVAPDDAFLSPVHNRESCYVAVHQVAGMEWRGYFGACEEVFNRYHGRPHWGKRHSQSAETLPALYPEWDRFLEVRRRLDPKGRFDNRYTNHIFGPIG